MRTSSTLQSLMIYPHGRGRRSCEPVGDRPTGIPGSCDQLSYQNRKEWAKEDGEYGELLRIAKTMDEAPCPCQMEPHPPVARRRDLLIPRPAAPRLQL